MTLKEPEARTNSLNYGTRLSRLTEENIHYIAGLSLEAAGIDPENKLKLSSQLISFDLTSLGMETGVVPYLVAPGLKLMIKEAPNCSDIDCVVQFELEASDRQDDEVQKINQDFSNATGKYLLSKGIAIPLSD